MKRLILATLMIALASAASAQNTTVSGTVTDSDSIAWASGTISFNLIGASGTVYCNGIVMTPSQLNVTVALDSSGSFSTGLCRNSSITPTSSQWGIRVCSATTAPCQTLPPTTISGSTQSLTSYIGSNIKAIRIPAIFGTSAYTDTEIVSPPKGATYFNLISLISRFWNGSIWQTIGSGAPLSPSTVTTSVRPYIDVTSPAYGAKCNGSDDTTAIQAAITAAQRSTTGCGTNSAAPTANCTGVVFFPNVVCYASHIQMAAYITLKGTGPNNSALVQLAGSNRHFITGTSPTVDQRMSIEDISINGNKSNQTGSFDCVNWDGTGALGTVRSTRNNISNTWVQNCLRDGINDFGDAGSDYITNSKGFSNGRYGVNLDKYDSHIPGGEWFSNGSGGINLGTHGNGSVTDFKSWGNGTTTTGFGLNVGSGNWRISSADLQDNFCWGATATGNNLVMEGLLLDGNGQTGGGLGCGGLQLTAVNYSHITGSFVAHVDAGTSDYVIGWVGSNNKNIVEIPISDASPPLVSSYSGTINNNNWLGNTVNGWLYNFNQEFLGGVSLRGFSDSGATQQWALLGNIGQLNLNSVGVGGGQIFSKPPHAAFSGSSGTTFTGINTNYGGTYTPTFPITITGFDIHLDTNGVGCSTWPVVSIYDETANAAVAGSGITLAVSTSNYHIAPGTNVALGHVLAFATTTAGVGCSTNPTSPHFNVEFEMQ